MSRRERDSDSRRHRSGFDREPSPKRSRRDGKPETERVTTDSNLDQKNRRRLQDALPLETPSGPASAKVESGGLSKEADKKQNGNGEASKHSSNPTEVSRSYFQHDERDNAGQVGRSFGRRTATEHRFRDSKDDRGGRTDNKAAAYDSRQRDEKPRGKGDNKSVWGHDSFLKMEAELPPPPVRKRPAFREKKIPMETDKATVEPARTNHSHRPLSVSERREERDRNPRHIDRSDRQAAGNREVKKSDLASRERFGGGNYRGRERFSDRQSYHPSGTRGEKWKHDLFDDSNRSPTTKNEEDQTAKIEALLAS
ncbi:hypothetical protein OIU76_015187 [Salix suchowensis]|uniref:Btz domain-containing protein n=3 Tax=Salix TaxID=40685 RepID=A0A9Q0Z046_9ROSI|nr:cyclin-related family protein [Salix suchowensis]KAJ6692396.1 hypothetical protein OIU79_014193 [Salix purpurea]KAJ6716490.1 hypothetical protein OIU74_009092 [Salix koriyanagi]KAJ6310411.1 hypothetical protein OIU76_015187 [Salix suchowensis]KAJ6345729.1 hypothetical protein OIU78_008395 [Salix suchowensis]